MPSESVTTTAVIRLLFYWLQNPDLHQVKAGRKRGWVLKIADRKLPILAIMLTKRTMPHALYRSWYMPNSHYDCLAFSPEGFTDSAIGPVKPRSPGTRRGVYRCNHCGTAFVN